MPPSPNIVIDWKRHYDRLRTSCHSITEIRQPYIFAGWRLEAFILRLFRVFLLYTTGLVSVKDTQPVIVIIHPTMNKPLLLSSAESMTWPSWRLESPVDRLFVQQPINSINRQNSTPLVFCDSFQRWQEMRKTSTYHDIMHDDVIEWKHFPRYWPFVRGIHLSPVNSPHKG